MSESFTFDGGTFDQERDGAALSSQLIAVRDFLISRVEWYSLMDLGSLLKFPEASISARLRDLRKPKFGGFIVERRIRQGTRTHEYRVRRPSPTQLTIFKELAT